MKNNILIIAVGIFFIHTVNAQSNLEPTHKETIDFIEQSINELKKLDPAGEVPADLREHYVWYQNDMETCEKQEYFEPFMQGITDNYKRNGKFATVKLVTKNEGATIKFQTIYEKVRKDHPRQADNPTNNCIVKLAPGQYYIWSERKGKPTSDLKRRVYIKLDSSLITLSEPE